MVTGENINLNDGMMPKKEQYKKNYPVETGKIMREKYENGLIRNIPLPDLQEQPENVQRPGSEVVEKGMLT